MKKKDKEKLNGFTLLELILVISIIGIMTGVSMVSMSSLKNNAKLKAAQSELSSTIKLAQSYALQGKTSGGTTPAYYGVIISDVKNYKVISCQSSDCKDGSGNWVYNDIEDYSFPAGVEVDNTKVNSLVTFQVPHGNVTLSVAPPLAFELKINGVSQTKKVSINANGNITEN